MSRIRRNIENLKAQPDQVRVRAATIFALVGTGVFAVIWMAVLLPLQLRGWGSGEDEAEAPSEVGVVSGVQNPEAVVPQPAPVQPEPLQELHGTRPTIRGVGEIPSTTEPSEETSLIPLETSRPEATASPDGTGSLTGLDEPEADKAESAE